MNDYTLIPDVLVSSQQSQSANLRGALSIRSNSVEFPTVKEDLYVEQTSNAMLIIQICKAVLSRPRLPA